MVRITRNFLIVAAILMPFFVFSPGAFVYADVTGQSQVFNTNETFDKLARKSIQATLRHVSANAYFYIEDNYWNGLGSIEQSNVLTAIKQLALEFDTNIYPKETSFWGQEPKPGVDDDDHVVILVEQLKSGHGGYFSTSNGYTKSIAPDSNEREMIIVGADSVTSSYAKSFLAHEFQHLISFNQKEILRRLSEDVWLNELRSEYSITLVGYNEPFGGSNLEKRAETFFDTPSDSLTEWPNVNLDYALVDLFSEYIAGQYGQGLLRETLQTNSVGIQSIDSVLASRGSSERFIDIFAKWLAASYINNDSINPKFSYTKSALKNFRALPQRLTIVSDSASSPQAANIFDYSLKPWQVYGHKIYVSVLAENRVIKLSPAYNSKFAYADNLGRFSIIDKDFYVTNPNGLEYFYIFPMNSVKTSDFGTNENESFLTLSASFQDKTSGIEFGSALKDGALIKRPREKETYVIEGKYKRYLRPEIIALYGHLDASRAIGIDDTTFNSHTTSNYVRYANDEKVYAVWPDGTKHWLHITARQWDDSGRDWGAIFIINDLELNTYKTGADIVK